MPRIMIFDDDKTFPAAIKRNFESRDHDQQLNWDIVLASPKNNGEDPLLFYKKGLEVLRAEYDLGNPFDLILTDLFMPEAEGGYSVLAEAKQIDPTLMTILFTGRIDEFDRKRAYELNVYAITKRADLGAKAVDELFYLSSAAIGFRNELKVAAARCFIDPAVAHAKATNSPHLGIASRTLSVVFWDIRGFSELTQRLITRPKVLVEFIQEYCDLARAIILKHNGILDKFIGDGVMALFGHPMKGPAVHDGVPAALDAALEFQREFDLLANRWAGPFQMYGGTTDLPRLGCGVHTDDVLVGYVGTHRGEFTAFGQGVNMASRVQDFAREVPIYVTTNVHARAKAVPNAQSKYFFEQRPKLVELKNIPGKHALFSLREPRLG